MEQPNVIVTYLTALRKTVRHRLIGYGLLTVLSGGITSFFTVVTLDWLFWLPSALRIFGGVLFMAGFVFAFVHWVLRPLRANLGIDELAAELERRFNSLQDRLSSTVNFLERGQFPTPGRDGAPTAGSDTMMRQVIADTEQIVQDFPLGAALSIRPLVSRGFLTAAGLIALCGILLVAPEWARTGLHRYVRPWDAVEWPRNVAIVPLTGGQTVALGESATVRMEIHRGLHDALRGVVHLREPNGRTQVLALQRDQDGVFYTTVDAITQDLEYWFAAGDDSTAPQPSKIRVVHRPEVVEALVTIEPPPYVTTSAVRQADLTDGAVSAPMGGYVTITLRTSKPIPADPTGEVIGLRMAGGEMVPLAVEPRDAQQLNCRFEVTQDVTFRAELRDEDGFANRGATSYTIRATPDGAPIVTVLEPLALTELTPTGSVRLIARVEDDFGIAALELHVEGPSEGKTSTVLLSEHFRTFREDNGVEASLSFLWSVEPLDLAAGDLLTYELVAEDNHAGVEDPPSSVGSSDGRGQLGRSAPMRIKVVGEGEFEIRVREDLASIEARLRQVAIEEAALRDRTMGLVHTDVDETALDANDRDTVANLAGGQSRLAHQLRELSLRLDELKGRMERNHIGDAESASRLAASGDALRRIAAGPMGEAVTWLGRVHEQTDSKEQQADLRSAAKAQEAAYDQLNALLHIMAQWSSFQNIVSRTRDLLDRQNSLRTETAEVGRSLLGKPVESLTPAEAGVLKRALRQQERLTGDVEQHLARMEQLAAGTRDKDPSAAEAMESALRAARAQDMTKRLRAAVEAIQSNRTAAAGVDQKAAAEAMRKMLAALRERDDRELAQLRKQLERAEEQVAGLIEEQTALRAATAEAGRTLPDPPSSVGSSDPRSARMTVGGDSSTFGSLEGEQRTLTRNAKSLGEELLEAPKAVGAGRLVRKSAVPMGKAEGELREQRYDPATYAQDEALTLLGEALDDLEALARQSAEEAMRRTLAHIHDDLEAMLAAQRMVNGGIAKLHSAVAELGRVGRAESREASKLSREQGEVREMVASLLPELEKVVVYEWALRRVTRWMDESRDRLEAREIDEVLTTTTERIARELEKLIAAVVETRSLPMSTEFAEAEMSGGGEGQTASATAVPTVAELLVLKAMQVDINERTRILGRHFDADVATETQLRQLTMIGEDQAEVRRLTEMVTTEARSPKFEVQKPPFFELRTEPPKKVDDLGERLIRRAVADSEEDLMATIVRLMTEASRKMEIEFDPGKETQALQGRIQEKLDEAIKTAASKQRARNQSATTTGPDKRRMPTAGKREQRPDQKAQGESSSKSASNTGEAPAADGRSEAERAALQDTRRSWGHLPRREREEVIQGVGEGFLERYRVWIERYYRALQESDE